MLPSVTNLKVLYRLNLKIFFLLLGFLLIGCSGGANNDNNNGINNSGNGGVEDSSVNANTSDNKGVTGTSGLCGDISYEGVKKTTNFPLYDLPANTVPISQDFAYYPVLNISAYDTLLQNNGLTRIQSNDTVKLYIHSLGEDIGVMTLKSNDGSFTAIITYHSNPSLLKAIIPVGVPLKQYQLFGHYTGERNFVINHIAQYKNSLKKLGFKETGDGRGSMEKKVGNCIYGWGYDHHDHYPNANNGYINYSWIISDKTFDDVIKIALQGK
ncbi:MAG: hypothetical protein LBL65_01875 [Campylobacteraceae bacterium]|jgi:hypothetical protein|nr:hypothetical protein [Campylobacteraceae bacterium]